jgi:hypothetical protein
MARGWESKSVEEQVAEKQAGSENPDAAARQVRTAYAQHQRDRQALELQRENILGQRTSSPHRRAALEAALADIEKKLKSLAAESLSIKK